MLVVSGEGSVRDRRVSSGSRPSSSSGSGALDARFRWDFACVLVREVAVAHASCFSPWLDAVRALVISVFSSPIRLPRILPVLPLSPSPCVFCLLLFAGNAAENREGSIPTTFEKTWSEKALLGLEYLCWGREARFGTTFTSFQAEKGVFRPEICSDGRYRHFSAFGKRRRAERLFSGCCGAGSSALNLFQLR